MLCRQRQRFLLVYHYHIELPNHRPDPILLPLFYIHGGRNIVLGVDICQEHSEDA